MQIHFQPKQHVVGCSKYCGNILPTPSDLSVLSFPSLPLYLVQSPLKADVHEPNDTTSALHMQHTKSPLLTQNQNEGEDTVHVHVHMHIM